MGFGHFTKWPPPETAFGHIAACESHRGLILVSIPMFSGSGNPIRTIIIKLGHLVIGGHLEFQNNRQWEPFLPISRPVSHIEALFWWLYPFFRVKEPNKNININDIGTFGDWRPSWISKWPLRWPPTNPRNHIFDHNFISRTDRDMILMSTHRF